MPVVAMESPGFKLGGIRWLVFGSSHTRSRMNKEGFSRIAGAPARRSYLSTFFSCQARKRMSGNEDTYIKAPKLRNSNCSISIEAVPPEERSHRRRISKRSHRRRVSKRSHRRRVSKRSHRRRGAGRGSDVIASRGGNCIRGG